MRIAIDIPIHFPPIWKVVAGALDYETRVKNKDHSSKITIVLPHAAMSTAKDRKPDNWDGVIVNKPNPELNIPQVLVTSGYPDDHVSVTINNREIAKLVVDQFLSMGLTSLVFFGRADWAVFQDRWDGFSQCVESHGLTPKFISSNGDDNPEEALHKLPKPCGIMTFNDGIAFRLFRICNRIGLEIPRDIQVISVDNSPACMESTPTLSSISMPFTLLGYHAAKLCAQMIHGESVESLQLPPSGLIIRESVNVENKDIQSAAEIAHYLNTNLSYPIQMADVARRSSLTRRRLEQVFKSAYGVSPMTYLRERRILLAMKILETSDAPLKDIVDACGFSDSVHLCRVFKKHTGKPPIAYRKMHSEGTLKV